MDLKKYFAIGMIFVLGIMAISFASAYMQSSPQYTQYQQGMFGFDKSSLEFDKEMCSAGNDFIIQLAPFGCTPAVVRSDLLEEQNVPVYCQLAATQINPLIDVEAIESISFSGQYPKEVAGVGFLPARAALGVSGNLNSPVLNNIGYVIIVLKKQENASQMPKSVTGNLSAKIKYDIKNAFGIGKTNFYLPVLSDAEWDERQEQYGFWNGKGYLRADEVSADAARISLYDGTNKVRTVDLQKGGTSEKIGLPGFQCLANLELKLNGLQNPDTRVRLQVGDSVVEVVKNEKFLDDKCYVSEIEKIGVRERVKVVCKEDTSSGSFGLGSKSFDLISSPKVYFNIQENSPGTITPEIKEAEIGDFLFDYKEGAETMRVYLGAVYSTKGVSDLEAGLISIPASVFSGKNLSLNELRYVDKLHKAYSTDKTQGGTPGAKISKDVYQWFVGGISNAINYLKDGKGVKFITYDLPETFGSKTIILRGFAEPVDEPLDDAALKDVKEYYEKAKADYESLRNDFEAEKTADTSITYAEEALYNQIILASAVNQKTTAGKLCKEFKEKYSKSKLLITQICSELKLSGSGILSSIVFVNGRSHAITFEGIYEPTKKEYGADIRIRSTNTDVTASMQKDDIYYLDEQKKSYIELVDLETDSARVRVSLQGVPVTERVRGFVGLGTYTINTSTPLILQSYSFSLTGVNLTKTASVSVIPGIEDAGSNTTFQFKIGIEDRTIELSPEKTKKIIKNMNETIKSWQDKSDKLGNVVKTMKGACLGVGAALTVKNFFANVGGRGIARQNVMRGEGGWSEICKQKVAAKEYSSLSACYTNNSAEIEKWVSASEKIIEAQNTQAQKDQKNAIQSGGIFGDKVVNTDKYIGVASPRVAQYLEQNNLINYIDSNGKLQNMSQLLSVDASKNEGIYTTNELREIEYNSQIINSNAPQAMRDAAKARLNNIYGGIYNAHSSYIGQQNAINTLGANVDMFSSSKDIIQIKYSDDIKYNSLTGYSGATISPDAKVRIVQDAANNKNYLLVIDDKGVVQKTYDISANKQLTLTSGSTDANPNPLKLQFTKYDSSTYNNPYKETPKVRWFETEPYKGLPAIVPVDVKKGWYASLKQTLPVFGGISAYDASGRVTSFYLCNIGKNGLEEERGGDDECTQINTGTGMPYNKIGGLSDTESKRLVDNAVKAIEEASKKYKAGISGQISILGQNVIVGSPAADIPDMQCEDMMSAKDCQLLFNVCDPVICPSSRCNLGGAYNVKDVVQSGIIGSLVLCLPNFPQVYVPICLTGVKAGMDGWISIQTSYRDCMQESLDTGKMTGICDEIYSIHACEFFWRQGLPIAKLAIPKLIEIFSGQNAARGGGEYLGVQNAWSNAESSLNYFTQYYAANAFKAFQARSAEQVGSEVCNSFVSGVYPSGDFLDTFTDPDSPAQFHGRFDEIPFTTATNPPTSQYKVFYHIFAGTDAGGYYKVYLRGSAGSSYYQDTSSSRLVASGFVKKGEYASQTVDFTAPSGYKEMCINVNGQEECGFKEVSTSFALDYVNDKYVQQQATEQAKTETECVSGSPSAYSLLSPSMEGAAQEIINPAIYNQGIIRICANQNPGKTTDTKAGTNESRWRDVGYCGDTKMRCWLDTQSVKNVIQNTNIENQTINDLNDYTQANMQVLISEGKYIENFDAELKKINAETDNLKKAEAVNAIYSRVFYSHQKAQLLYIRGEAYDKLAKTAQEQVDKEKSEAKKATITKEDEILAIAEAEAGYRTVELITLNDGEAIAFNKTHLIKISPTGGILTAEISESDWTKWKADNEDRILVSSLITKEELQNMISRAITPEPQEAGKEQRYTNEEENDKAVEFLQSGDKIIDTGHGSIVFVYKGNNLWTSTAAGTTCNTKDCSTSEIFDSLRESTSKFKYYPAGITTAKEFNTILELITYLESTSATLYRDRLKNLFLYEVGINSNNVLTGNYYTIGRIIETNGQYSIAFGSQYNAIRSLTGTKTLTEEEAKEILCNFKYSYVDNEGKTQLLFPVVVEKVGVSISGKYPDYAKDCVPTLPGIPYTAPTTGTLPNYPAIIVVRFSWQTSVSYKYDRVNKGWLGDGLGYDWSPMDDVIGSEFGSQDKIAGILKNKDEKQGYECFIYFEQNKPSNLETISGVPTNFEAKKCFDF